ITSSLSSFRFPPSLSITNDHLAFSQQHAHFPHPRHCLLPLLSTLSTLSTLHYQPMQNNNPFPCQWDGCRQRFATLERLFVHVENEHIGRIAYGNRCLECRWDNCTAKAQDPDKVYKRRHQIVSHMKTHIPWKEHFCELGCHEGFTRKSDLNKHQRNVHGSQQSNPATAATTDAITSTTLDLAPTTPSAASDRSTPSVISPDNCPLTPEVVTEPYVPGFFPRFLGDMSINMSPLQPWDMDGMMSISSTSQPTEEFSSQFEHQSANDYASQMALLVEGRPRDEFDNSEVFGDVLTGIMGNMTQEARREHDGGLYNEEARSFLEALHSCLEVAGGLLSGGRLITSLRDVQNWNDLCQVADYCNTLYGQISDLDISAQWSSTAMTTDEEQSPSQPDCEMEEYLTPIYPNIGVESASVEYFNSGLIPQSTTVHQAVSTSGSSEITFESLPIQLASNVKSNLEQVLGTRFSPPTTTAPRRSSGPMIMIRSIGTQIPEKKSVGEDWESMGGRHDKTVLGSTQGIPRRPLSEIKSKVIPSEGVTRPWSITEAPPSRQRSLETSSTQGTSAPPGRSSKDHADKVSPSPHATMMTVLADEQVFDRLIQAAEARLLQLQDPKLKQDACALLTLLKSFRDIVVQNQKWIEARKAMMLSRAPAAVQYARRSIVPTSARGRSISTNTSTTSSTSSSRSSSSDRCGSETIPLPSHDATGVLDITDTLESLGLTDEEQRFIQDDLVLTEEEKRMINETL
ncbi:MAG: hypothetical protein J3Q66DRAFT_13609, partial [Benniella sp.]